MQPITPDYESAPISEVLRYFRERLGMTQHDLAQAAGVTDGMVGNIESGRRNLGHTRIAAFADALELTPEEQGHLLAARNRTAGVSEPRWNSRDRPNQDIRDEIQAMLDQISSRADLMEARAAVSTILKRHLEDFLKRVTERDVALAAQSGDEGLEPIDPTKGSKTRSGARKPKRQE